MPDETLPVVAGAEGGVSPETPVPGGVETTAPVAVPATPTQPASDGEDWRARYESDMAKAQADLNALKSSLQSQNAQIRREAEQSQRALEQELHKLRMASMDEPERKEYELSMTRNELNDMKAQLEQERTRANELNTVPSLIASFGRMGIPTTVLDLEHGPDALAESGWRAVVQKMQYLENAVRGITTNRQSAAAPAAPAHVAPASPQQPGTFTPPPVAPAAGGPVTTGRTWGSVLKSLSDQTGRPWTEEDVYQEVEQGRLPPTILPGMENLPAR